MISRQVIFFGVVGVLAAVVHFFAVLLLVHWLHWVPLLANILAFLIAFQVSYHGHSIWTFAQQSFDHSTSLGRFFIVAVASFALNEALFALLLYVFNWPYVEALVVVLLIVPPVTFLASKLWAFQREVGNASH